MLQISEDEIFIPHIENSPNELNDMILHVAGNKGDEIIENLKLAEKIKMLTNRDMRIIHGKYEPGEVIDGKPISFSIEYSTTRKILKWVPKYTIEEGLKETINWFEDNLWRYNTR